MTLRRRLFKKTEHARAKTEARNGELRELDALKDELLALVSHELRTPLTSIRGYLELVLEDTSQPLSDEQREFLDVVDRNSIRLMRLVNDLLLLASVHAGRLEVETRPVDIESIARESLAAARPSADRGLLSLSLRTEGSVIASLDSARIAQVIDNLLSNAVKFTPPGGAIELSVYKDIAAAVIEVTDTGMGISASDQAQLFSRFFRGRSDANSAIEGTGLGLAISQALVESHGGTIDVRSVEGEGTTFRVKLPLVAEQALEPVEEVAA